MSEISEVDNLALLAAAVLQGHPWTRERVSTEAENMGLVSDSLEIETLAAVLGVGEFEKAMRRRHLTVPDVSAEVRDTVPAADRELIELCMTAWRLAAGQVQSAHPPTLEHPYLDALEQLESLGPLPLDAPVLVSHPVEMLAQALEQRNAPCAYLYLKDSAEGVARLAWLVMLGEAIALVGRVEDPTMLDKETGEGISALLSSAVAHSFSFGATVWHLCGSKPSTLAMLAASSGRERLPCTRTLNSAFEASSIHGPLYRLRDWRNRDLGHGLIGRELRIHQLFRPSGRADPDPVRDLVEVLSALSAWLTQTHAWLGAEGWPESPGAPPQDADAVPAPEPVAWLGGGAPLWVLDQMQRDSLRLLDVLGGGRSKRHGWRASTRVLGIVGTAAGRAIPIEQSVGARPDADRDFQSTYRERVVSNPLVERLASRVRESPVVWICGGGGTGKSFLTRQRAHSGFGGSLSVETQWCDMT